MEYDPQRKGTYERTITELSQMRNLYKVGRWYDLPGDEYIRNLVRSEEFEMDDVKQSEIMQVGNIPWVVECEKELSNYSFFLTEIDERVIEAEFRIRIISKDAATKDIVKDWRMLRKNLFDADHHSILFYEGDINEELSHYVENDSIRFKIDIEIKKAAFVGCWDMDFYKPTKLSDAVIVVEEEKIHVNKTFLAIHSEYFEKMFEEEGNEEGEYECEVESIDIVYFLEFLRFIYPVGDILVDDIYMNMMLNAAGKMGLLQHVKNVVTELYMTEEIKNGYHHWYPFSKHFLTTVNEYQLTELHDDLLESLSKNEIEKLLTEEHCKDIPEQSRINFLKRYLKLNTTKNDDKQQMKKENLDFIASDFLNPTKFSDVVLIVEGKKCHVNKVLMAMNSPVFETMFYGGFREKNQSEIELKEIEYDSFVSLLSLIHPHANRVRIGANNVEAIQKLADRFDVTRVIQLCERYRKKFDKNVLPDLEARLSGLSAESRISKSDHYRLVD